jgi:hypothetical protein
VVLLILTFANDAVGRDTRDANESDHWRWIFKGHRLPSIMVAAKILAGLWKDFVCVAAAGRFLRLSPQTRTVAQSIAKLCWTPAANDAAGRWVRASTGSTLARFQPIGPLQRLGQVVDQGLAIERLGQETHRPGRQCPRLAVLLGKSRDENDGQPSALGDQLTLQVNPAHARHSYIRDQTGRFLGVRRPQEVFSRREPMGNEPMHAHEPHRCDPNGFVVIDD